MKNTFKIISTIICDDIRKEISGKDILIGVYTGIIPVPHIPHSLSTFGIRIEFETKLKNIDQLIIEVRSPTGKVIFSATGPINIPQDTNTIAVALVCSPLEINELGNYSIFFGPPKNPLNIYNFKILKTP